MGDLATALFEEQWFGAIVTKKDGGPKYDVRFYDDDVALDLCQDEVDSFYQPGDDVMVFYQKLWLKVLLLKVIVPPVADGKNPLADAVFVVRFDVDGGIVAFKHEDVRLAVF